MPFFSFFLSILSRSNFDHHLRCGGWLNFEFSKREKHSGRAIKTIYKKLCRGMLKHIPLYQYCHFQTTMTFEHLFHVNILLRLNEQSNTCRQQVPLETR